MGGLGPPFLRLDGVYASGTQARHRAVFRAGLGGVLGFAVGCGLARSEASHKWGVFRR